MATDVKNAHTVHGKCRNDNVTNHIDITPGSFAAHVASNQWDDHEHFKYVGELILLKSQAVRLELEPVK